MNQCENRLVIDSEWIWIDLKESVPEEVVKGYENISSGEFIPVEDALEYAREHAEQGEDTDQEFVDWFFSGNWILRGEIKTMELKINEVALPQSITFNYEEMKQELEEKVSYYNGLVYTDAEIKQAKADKANLNKLKKALNDERIRLEKEWMKPFDVFKSQVRDLIATIEKPVEAIDTQVKGYEEQQRQNKAKEIREYWNNEIVKPDWLELDSIFDEKWLNASTTMKSVKDSIAKRIGQIESDMEMLSKLPVFGFEAQEVYKTTLDVNTAVSEANRMSEIAKKKQEAENKQEEKLILEELVTSDDEVEEIAEIEEMAIPSEECVIPTSEDAVTFRAVMSMDDKLALIEWFESRNITFEVIK